MVVVFFVRGVSTWFICEKRCVGDFSQEVGRGRVSDM